jgi:hypothetical protein
MRLREDVLFVLGVEGWDVGEAAAEVKDPTSDESLDRRLVCECEAEEEGRRYALAEEEGKPLRIEVGLCIAE